MSARSRPRCQGDFTPNTVQLRGIRLAMDKLMFRIELGGNRDEWTQREIREIRAADLWARRVEHWIAEATKGSVP